jgi:hypothetical protein
MTTVKSIEKMIILQNDKRMKPNSFSKIYRCFVSINKVIYRAW